MNNIEITTENRAWNAYATSEVGQNAMNIMTLTADAKEKDREYLVNRINRAFSIGFSAGMKAREDTIVAKLTQLACEP